MSRDTVVSKHTEADAGEGLVLALDTSSDAAVALCRTGPGEQSVQVLARSRSGDGRRHAETLVPMIQQVLTGAGADADQVGAVVAGTGPAPFTGLRVGLVTARGFARARGISAYGVCSLDALALAAGAGGSAVSPGGTGGLGTPEVLVVTDARRREVYYARYRVGAEDVTAVAGPAVAAPAQVAADHADLIEAGAVFGPAAVLYADVFTPAAGATPAGAAGSGEAGLVPDGALAPGAPVDPALLAQIMVHRRSHDGDLSLEPRYLRRPDVHHSAGRKRAS
ncbi:tRNA (adenosine(37)-N6)-threonylcarbamoyltransferase complex dimerization subunit type 1 TsaB [Pseudactinotalea sp. Z1732]|uniref:tRNA (adenosine(37)-N6)-threonylcarbamoyltransferase complex dimerization subunit type 1 TsaB n=1 Tax=Pseudactinotalea sp. Z1732 TaxID=3413026 RepID=UPI003C7C9C03